VNIRPLIGPTRLDGNGIVRTIFVSECEGDFAEKLDAAIEAAAD